MAPDDPRLARQGVLVIDARSPAEFRAWHLPGARSVPFDYLEPIGDGALRDVASSGAPLVAVYGDGADPDSGRELAKELSARGVRAVFHVQGGAPALGAGKR